MASPAPENDATGSVTILFRDVCAGSPEALRPLWDRYFPRLMQLARRTLGDGRQREAGADDAVQSAFFAFWRQADGGAFDGKLHRDNLWALLSVMTVRKARNQVRRESASDWHDGCARPAFPEFQESVVRIITERRHSCGGCVRLNPARSNSS